MDKLVETIDDTRERRGSFMNSKSYLKYRRVAMCWGYRRILIQGMPIVPLYLLPDYLYCHMTCRLRTANYIFRPFDLPCVLRINVSSLIVFIVIKLNQKFCKFSFVPCLICWISIFPRFQNVLNTMRKWMARAANQINLGHLNKLKWSNYSSYHNLQLVSTGMKWKVSSSVESVNRHLSFFNCFRNSFFLIGNGVDMKSVRDKIVITQQKWQ